jgi:hypothetical protein
MNNIPKVPETVGAAFEFLLNESRRVHLMKLLFQLLLKIFSLLKKTLSLPLSKTFCSFYSIFVPNEDFLFILFLDIFEISNSALSPLKFIYLYAVSYDLVSSLLNLKSCNKTEILFGR